MAVSDINFVANTYAGDALTSVISNALLMENGLADAGLVTLIPNVKGPKKMRKANLSVSLNDPTALFSGATGDIDLDESVLTPIEMGFDKDYDLSTLADSWEVSSIQAGAANDGNGTPEFNAWLEKQITDQLSIASEKLYARGKANTTEALFTATYPGLTGRFEASASTIKLASSVGSLTASAISIASDGVVTVSSTATLRDGDTVTILGANGAVLVGGLTINGQSFQITIASGTTFTLGATTTGTAATAATVQFINEVNVVSTLTKVVNRIPLAVRDSVNIVMGVAVGDAFEKACANSSLERSVVGKRELDYLGRKLITRKHWNANTIAAFAKDNVFLGVDLASDSNTFRVINMQDVTGDEVIRIRAKMKSDIVAAKYNEIVYLRPA
jgi:hypothetical protein